MADIDAFIRAPSQEALGNFSMEQLLIIAEHFSVEVVGDKRLKSTIKASIESALCETGVLPAEKEGVVKPLWQASSLSFEQQKEILLLQLSHDKRRYEMEFEKEISVERMRQETEKAKIDMEGQRLSMGEWHGVQGPKSPPRFDANNLRLLPQFNESDPDTFFCFLNGWLKLGNGRMQTVP